MLSCSLLSYVNNFIYNIMFCLLHSPGGLVEPVVEDDTYVDVVDVDRSGCGFMLGNVVVFGVLDEVVDVS